MRIILKYSSVVILTIGLSIMLSQNTIAQSDTTGTAAKTDSIIQYLTPLEYAFMMHEETKFMLRVPVFGVGAELEVLPYVTLIGQAQLLVGDYYDYNTGFTAEARYYYGSKKKGVRNMSGNYVSLSFQHQSNFPSNINADAKLFYTRWGMQRRFLGSGLIDLGVNLGYKKIDYYTSDENNSVGDERIFFQTTGTIGLGFVFNNEKTLNQDRLCPVVKCFERETFLLKINTLNLLSFQYSDMRKQSTISVNPQIGIEQKLFSSPFTIGANLKLNYNWIHSNSNKSFTSSYSELFGRIQARYYYNLKSRIQKGKSGNGLSANYISGGVYQGFTGLNDPLKLTDYGITFTTGIQRTFSEHLYFDVELGGAYEFKNSKGFLPYGALQVGIKF